MRIFRFGALFAALFVVMVFGLPAQAALTLDVYASSAPNAYGSPSWNGYTTNALNALENGLSNVGGSRDTTPTAYEQLSTFVPGDVMVTSFNSWRGLASPGVPFGSDLGNRLHFGLHITGDGVTQFRLNDLVFDMNSGDPGNSLDWDGNFVGYDFNCTTRYGIDWGADNVKGGGDDSQVCGAGSGLVLIDEMVYVGVGNAFWPQVPGQGATEQEALDAVAQYILDNVGSIWTTYSIVGTDQQTYSGTASVTLAVSEPSTLPMLLGMVGPALGLGLFRRRRQKTT